jgi:uncharacterized protein DUF4352
MREDWPLPREQPTSDLPHHPPLPRPSTPWDATLPSYDAPTQMSRLPVWPAPPITPPYAQPSPAPAKPRGSVGRTLAIIAATLGGVFLACCVALLIVASVTGNALATLGRTAQQTQTAHARLGPSHVGGAIAADGVSCTLVSARVLPAGLFITPRAGNEYVLVHVTLVNSGAGEAHYSPLDFHIKSGTGVITGPDFIYPTTYTAKNPLDTGVLAPGARTEGDILFQAPTGDHALQLTWQPNIFASVTENAWSLGL